MKKAILLAFLFIQSFSAAIIGGAILQEHAAVSLFLLLYAAVSLTLTFKSGLGSTYDAGVLR